MFLNHSSGISFLSIRKSFLGSPTNCQLPRSLSRSEFWYKKDFSDIPRLFFWYPSTVIVAWIFGQFNVSQCNNFYKFYCLTWNILYHFGCFILHNAVVFTVHVAKFARIQIVTFIQFFLDKTCLIFTLFQFVRSSNFGHSWHF